MPQSCCQRKKNAIEVCTEILGVNLKCCIIRPDHTYVNTNYRHGQSKQVARGDLAWLTDRIRQVILSTEVIK